MYSVKYVTLENLGVVQPTPSMKVLLETYP